RVQATVDLKSLHVPFWDRLVDPVPRGSRQHIFASVQADEEVTLLLGRAKAPPALESWHVSELLSIPEHVIDLGLGDLDGDGRAELVVLQEDRIEVFELAEGRARKLASHQVGSIPEAAIRTRDPNGSLLVVDFNRDGQFEVFYKLFNRRYGQVLTWTGAYLKEVRRLDSVPICLLHRDKRPVVVYARPETGTNRYGPEIEVADINSARGKTYRLPSAFLSFRCWQGREGDAVAIASSAGGRLIRLDSGFKPQKVDEPAGVGLAVLDLDMDSVPEMVLSDPVWPGEPDSVRVLSGDQTVWRSRDVIGGIVSVAGGDLDGRGKVQAVLAAVDPGGQSSRIYLLGR
ncbi:MAG: VCBS repeat-containing protein, partial [Deltaproteobacteria bacterium]|nr:VCBS repeat-containing protein [Deltaproteobacteria bacterium]